MPSQTESFYVRVLRSPDPRALRSAATGALVITGIMMYLGAIVAYAMGGEWVFTGVPTAGKPVVLTGVIYPTMHIVSAVAVYFTPERILKWAGFPLAVAEIVLCFSADIVNSDWAVTGQLYYYIPILVAAFSLSQLGAWTLFGIAVAFHGVGLLIIGPPWIAMSEWLISAGVAATITYGLSTVRHEQRLLRAQWTELSRRDSLTGLFNRQTLDDTFAYYKHSSGPASLMVVDIDNFKHINDTCGHPFGDHVLQAVAEALRCTLGDCGHAFRIGGDELVAYLPNADIETSERLAQRFVDAVNSTDFEPSGGGSLTVTCSVGIAEWPADGTTHSALYLAADAALYEAKRRGRDTICSARDADRAFDAPVTTQFTSARQGRS